MKLKWLWTTWAYVATLGVVALNIWALAFCTINIIPKMEKIRHDGLLIIHDSQRPAMDWMFSWLGYVSRAWGMLWWLPWTLAALWGLFEWRVRGESKPFIRLSILGTAALALTAAVVLTAGSLVLPTFMGFPISPTPGRNVLLKMARLDAAVGALHLDGEKEDWTAAEEDERMASLAVDGVVGAGTQWLAFTPPEEKWEVDNYLLRMTLLKAALGEVQKAIQAKDLNRLKTALRTFHELNNAPANAPTKVKGDNPN